jgi:hypothetical protein
VGWINVKAGDGTEGPSPKIRNYKLLKNVNASIWSIDWSADTGNISPKREGEVSLTKDMEIPLVDDNRVFAHLKLDSKKFVVGMKNDNYVIIPSKAVIQMDIPGQTYLASWINVRAEKLPMEESEAREWLKKNRPDLQFHAVNGEGIWTAYPVQTEHGPSLSHGLIPWKDIK